MYGGGGTIRKEITVYFDEKKPRKCVFFLKI